jgi:hypothetical protein
MKFPPLLSSRPVALQVLLAGAVPIVFGALCGWMVGVNEAVYLLLAVPIATLGGFAAGFEHSGARSGARRGAIGGALFGASLVIAHEISGKDAKADLPDPAILLAVVTTVLGSVLGAFGARIREKRDAAVAR